MVEPGPFLSVIVPAHNGSGVLPRCLSALAASDLRRREWELIVVDDVSTDDTPRVAARWADVVVRLGGKPHGPAFARNRGFEVSRGRVLVFVDADVCVHPDTLGRFAALFRAEPEVSAVFGSYDLHPAAPGVVSQYRNLLHAYVHHRNAGEAETFWAGCGAIRRAPFAEVGMFDEWQYAQPQIEDVEIGRRLRRHGHRILLRPEIQATHLKRWTFRNVVATDFGSRGVPWMRLLLREGPASAHTLNLRATEKLCTGLVGAALLAVIGSPWTTPWLLAFAAAALATVLLINRGFYGLLIRHRGGSFAAAVIPMHLLYYLLNGVSVLWGSLLHQLFGEPQPSAETSARSQMGIETWPPIPSRPRSGGPDGPAQRTGG